MRGQTLGLRLVTVILAAYLALGTSAVRPQAMAPDAPLSALWEQPHDLRDQDLFNGPWGAARAPDPDAVYTFVRLKTSGTNPGVVVQDPAGREWHVKQPPRQRSRRGRARRGRACLACCRPSAITSRRCTSCRRSCCAMPRARTGSRADDSASTTGRCTVVASGRGSKTRSSGRGRSRGCWSSC